MARNPNFDKLQAEWYGKLAESGFYDIEYANGSIQSGTPRSTKAKDPSLRQATEEYYYMSYHFLTDHTFANELEKVIWEYYSEGLSIRDICKILADTNVATLKRTSVWGIVKRLETEMKHRYLSP